MLSTDCYPASWSQVLPMQVPKPCCRTSTDATVSGILKSGIVSVNRVSLFVLEGHSTAALKPNRCME